MESFGDGSVPARWMECSRGDYKRGSVLRCVMRIRTEAFLSDADCCGDNGPQGHVRGTHLSCVNDEMVVRCCLEEGERLSNSKAESGPLVTSRIASPSSTR